jgi:hypothetical protein
MLQLSRTKLVSILVCTVLCITCMRGGGGGRKNLAEIRWQDKKAGKANEKERRKIPVTWKEKSHKHAYTERQKVGIRL